MRIALAQINPTVGDIRGNASLIIDRTRQARDSGSSVVVFPELSISGYPPEDLLLKDHFLDDCRQALDHIAANTQGIMVVLGLPLREGELCYNAAAVIAEGVVAGWYRKIWLPNYAVFDEMRYFVPGDRVLVVDSGDIKMAVTICEDIWQELGPGEVGVLDGGAGVIVNLSMSPYHRGKGHERAAMLVERAKATRAYVCYVNGIGGQDELVFDGQSMAFDPWGDQIACAAQFQEELLLVDVLPAAPAERDDVVSRTPVESPWPVDHVRVSVTPTVTTGGEVPFPSHICPPLVPEAEVYEALRLGVEDYAGKNDFQQVVIGISGGIDSAVTACVAADALGAEKVNVVSMPSRFSSADTKSDAREVAERLGVNYLEISIEELFGAYLEGLSAYLAEDASGITQQNIQARIRGNLLMALSNKFGWLVLTTGNKSEMAVGYATLYGDMAGGFAVLKDVPKTLVYKLAEYRNSLGPDRGPIPASTITRAPSAELAPEQTDQDTLPPYEVLDRIIEAYVVQDRSLEEMVAAGLDGDVVRRVVAMIDGNEYKRRQSAPGVRITPKAFGKDRRLPITNRYRG
jgi:NAD+ synthase (glutamine-hydrolysing)